MGRYFMEVAYKGTAYSGFQIQDNAATIQSEIEKAFFTLHRQPVALTGSSRTDAGVHAYQNFFHFDFDDAVNPQAVYKLNAILPHDIVVRDIIPMPAAAHSRFDAISREYIYNIHQFKNPFLKDTSYYYPYRLNKELLEEGAAYILSQQQFYGFAKSNSQVKNFNCHINTSRWVYKGEQLHYNIAGNRFLRGMVRLLTGSLLKLGRGKITLAAFQEYFEDGKKCGISAPAHGLHLAAVTYPSNLLRE